MTNETNPGTVEVLRDRLEAIVSQPEATGFANMKASLTRHDFRQIIAALAAQSQPAATVQEVGQDVTKDVLASLVAALSILNRAHAEHKEPRKVVSSDAMFAQMLKDYEASVVRARAALTAEPAAKAGDAPFEFDRYINGKLMAEGVTIERETTLEAAMVVAARIASKGANGEAPVLVYRPPALPRNSPSPQPDMGSGEAVADTDDYRALLEAGFDDYTARCALRTEADGGFCHAYFYSDGQWRFQTSGSDLTDRAGATIRCVLTKRLYATPLGLTERYRAALTAIRDLLAHKAGFISLEGDAYKIADEALATPEKDA